MTAVAVMCLIVVLTIGLMVAWSMYSDEHQRRIRAEHRVAELLAELGTQRSATGPRVWRTRIPTRVHVPIVSPPTTQETPMTPQRRRLFGRPLALAAVFVAVLAAAAGCIPQPAVLGPFSNPDPTAAAVVVFGDSLGAMARQPALALWADQPDVTVSYNAVGGTEAADWLPAMGLVTEGQCVVYELGTNDLSHLGAHQAEWNTLAALNELADADRVIALTLNTTGGDLRGAPFAADTRHFNTFLRRTLSDGTYPNLELLDWEARSAGKLGWLAGPIPGGDVLHYNAEGTQQFAQALVDAGGMC